MQIESSGSGVEDERVIEEGEIPLHVVQHAQATILQLHPVIQSRVSNGMPPPPPGTLPYPPVPPPPGGHPTLASVRARSQPQYNQPPPPSSATPTSSETPDAPPEPASVDTPRAEEAANSMSLSWLTDEQTKLLEQAIAQAASAAQAQAEAEAALEESEDDDDADEDELEDS